MRTLFAWARAFWHRAKLKASAVGLAHEAQALREEIAQMEQACTLPDGRYIVLPAVEERLASRRAELQSLEGRRDLMSGRLRAAGA
jgi:hypothetical protein